MNTTQPNSSMPPVPTGSPYHSPTPPPPIQPPEKVRRVGTLTMALSLIAVGVILLLKVFVPGLSYATIARLSPIILVFLGVEILVSYVRFKDTKFKYDILSVFISLILIGSSLLVATIPEIYYRERQLSQFSNQLSLDLEDQVYSALQDEHVLASVDAYISLDRDGVKQDITLADLARYDYVQLRIVLNTKEQNKENFIATCQLVLNKIEKIVPRYGYISIYNQDEGDFRDYNSQKLKEAGLEKNHLYILGIDNPSQLKYNAAELENMIITETWPDSYEYDGGYYDEDGNYHEDTLV